MIIRIAKEEDAKQIVEILKDTPEIRDSDESQLDPLVNEDYIKSYINDKEHSLSIVAEDNSHIVGFIIAEIWPKQKYSYLGYIIVRRDFIGKGVGTKMYLEYERILRERGFSSVELHVGVNNERMQGFCEKHGFKKGLLFYYYSKEL